MASAWLGFPSADAACPSVFFSDSRFDPIEPSIACCSVCGHAGAHHPARVADLVAHLVVADRVGALGELARGLFLLRPQIARRSIELLLELADFLLERRLPLDQLLRLFLTPLARGVEPLDVVGDLLLLARELLGLLQRVLHVALGAARLRLLQPPLAPP